MISSTLASAIGLPIRTSVQARAQLLSLGALARQRAAVELELAGVLAWLRRCDPVDLGHVTWTAFCGARVDWRGGWLRNMVRLAESPLARVRAAAAEGLLPLRVAVRAPGRVLPGGEEAWLAEAVIGPVDHADVRDVFVGEVFVGDEAETVRRARLLARLLLGYAAPDRETDAYILRAWRLRIPAATLLDDARTPPSAPTPPPTPAPPDATAGPPRVGDPRSLPEALARLDALQATLRGSLPVLARAWSRVVEGQLWTDAGYNNAAEATEAILGMSLRNGQRLAKLGYGLDWYPEVEAALALGLAPRTAEQVVGLAPDHDAGAWLALAERVGRREHARALHDARQGPAGRRTLERYHRAIAVADRWAATEEGARALAAPVGPDDIAVETEQATPAVSPPMRVALPHAEPAAFSRGAVRAQVDLLPAARWLLAEVVLPPARGFARVRERDGHRCTNPECGRRSLRVEAHHLHARAFGGSDDLLNGATLCRMCHVRGIHAGRLGARRLVVEGHDAILWAWPGGRRVLQFRDEPGRPSQGYDA